jgi:hypothetical protein
MGQLVAIPAARPPQKGVLVSLDFESNMARRYECAGKFTRRTHITYVTKLHKDELGWARIAEIMLNPSEAG